MQIEYILGGTKALLRCWLDSCQVSFCHFEGICFVYSWLSHQMEECLEDGAALICLDHPSACYFCVVFYCCVIWFLCVCVCVCVCVYLTVCYICCVLCVCHCVFCCV